MCSACFTRGNNRLLELLEDQSAANGWQDRIALSGARCHDLGGNGPNIFINGKLYQGLDEGALLDLLQNILGVPHGNTSRMSVRKTAMDN